MSEYDIVCEVCGRTCEPTDGLVSWSVTAGEEHDHALTHTACVPAEATQRVPLARLLAPQEFLVFVTERIGARLREPDRVRTIVFALAPFHLRPANGVEMNVMRAASFGKTFGVDPFKTPPA